MITDNVRKEFRETDPEGRQVLEVISEAVRFNRWMYETIAPHCAGNILEIGSGIGNISRYFIEDNRQIVLSDIRTNYCEYLEKTFRLNEGTIIKNLDLVDTGIERKFPQYFGTFDTVFALNVIEHIDNDELAISNAVRFLKPGGTFIVLVPAYQFLYNSIDRKLGHYRRYTKSYLKARFIKNGLLICSAKYFNASGIIGWFVSGKIQKNKTVPRGQMRLFDRLVPVFRVVDKCLFNRTGLSVIVIGSKPTSE